MSMGETSASRWRELLDDLASQVPDLAAEYVGRLKAVAGYGPDSAVADRELQDTATTCISLLIEGIRDGYAGARLNEVASELGTRRAFQRVPADSLAVAVNLDFAVIWSRLLESCGPKDAIVLTTHVEPTWRTVDAFTAAVMASYRREASRLAQREANQRQGTIGRLFAASRPTEALARSVAFELGCDPEAEFTVIVVDQADSQDRAAQALTRVRHAPVFAHRSMGTVVFFWPSTAGDDPLDLVRDGVRAARVRGVRGLTAVPSSTRTLLRLIEAIDPLQQCVIDLESDVPSLARNALAEQGVDLRMIVEYRLDACAPAERDRIVETVRTYSETGSVHAAAASLHCHRNTVLNRLSRFTELTGLDLNIPRDAATALICLRA